MKRILPFCLLALCAALRSFGGESLESIFNGHDLTGWRVPDPNPWWSAADGVLVGKEDEQMKGNVLETEKLYHDAIVETEVRWTGDIDSGIFLRKGQRWQCQIGVSRSLKTDMTCSIYVPKGGYVVKAHDVDKLLKIGDWNKIRIEARGDHYKIWLNGEVVLETDLPGYDEPGPIGLQIHPHVKDMKVEFRNMKAAALDEVKAGGTAAPAKSPAAAAPGKASGDESTALFNGKDLTGWKVTDFAGHGDVTVENGKLVLAAGDDLTGVNYTGAVPKMNYEISLDAMLVDGSDFFCGLTFPIGDACSTFVAGGWGGGVVGISSIDDRDASENETTKYMKFDAGKWYHVRVRVTPAKIEAWLGDEKVADVKTAGHKFGMRRGEIEMSEPLGLATWRTKAAYRDIKVRPVKE
jgi:3-keto-disaccharide hydrolase